MQNITDTPQTKRISQKLREKFKNLTHIKSVQTRFGNKFHIFTHNTMNLLYVVKVVETYGKDQHLGNLVNLDFTPHGGKCFLSPNELKLVKSVFLGGV